MKEEEEVVVPPPDSEREDDVYFFSECVWFSLRLIKGLRDQLSHSLAGDGHKPKSESQKNYTNHLVKQLTGSGGDCLPHTCLALLHAYCATAPNICIKDLDPYFTTTACFFVATKLTSVHITSEQLMQVFFDLRM